MRQPYHNQVLVLGVERGNLFHKLGILLLPMRSDGEVVGNIPSTGDMALVKILPHPASTNKSHASWPHGMDGWSISRHAPDIQIVVCGRAEEGACFLRIHRRNTSSSHEQYCVAAESKQSDPYIINNAGGRCGWDGIILWVWMEWIATLLMRRHIRCLPTH